MLFSDLFLLEMLVFTSVLYFMLSSNIMLLLYTSGLYLVFIGLYSMLNDADIYIGFLWVIDLGVGLVFFIFMLHFTSFLHQKTYFDISNKLLTLTSYIALTVLLYLYFFSYTNDSSFNGDLLKTWFFHVTYIDYYSILHSCEITELNLLRDSYFILNTFEFFVINFSLFFGLISAILLYFLIQRVFNILNFSQILEANTLSSIESSFFIKHQNFINQQNMPQSVRVWKKIRS
jgi:hypothetical protein